MKHVSKKGFTLTEMMIVIAIIVIIAGAVAAGIAIDINRYNSFLDGQKAKYADGDDYLHDDSLWEAQARREVYNIYSSAQSANAVTMASNSAAAAASDAAAAAASASYAATHSSEAAPSSSAAKTTKAATTSSAAAATTQASSGGGGGSNADGSSCIPQGASTISGTVGGGGDTAPGSFNISNGGKPIIKATITFYNDYISEWKEDIQVDGGWMYSVRRDGNTFTITYTGSNNSWDQPLTGFKITNVHYNDSRGNDGTGNAIQLGYVVSYN